MLMLKSILLDQHFLYYALRFLTLNMIEQVGTGPSRRHIQGSKVAKGLPRVNLQYSKNEKAKKWTKWPAGAR